MMGLSESLYSRLVDYLCNVPSLKNKNGRNSWLTHVKSFPKPNDRDPHVPKNDLRFILSHYQDLEGKNGEWALVILLRALQSEVKELKIQDKEGESIELPDLIKEVEQALKTKTSSKDSEGEKTPIAQEGDEKLPGNGNSRWGANKVRIGWLKKWGFTMDPFIRISGVNDTYLEKYFYEDFKWYNQIVNAIDRMEPLIIFGQEGIGKSSLRSMLAQHCRKEGRKLVVEIEDLDPIVRANEVNERAHVDTIIRESFSEIINDIDNNIGRSDISDVTLRECQQLLWPYVAKYVRREAQRKKLERAIDLDISYEEDLQEDPKDLLVDFCYCVTTLLGYTHICVFVDPHKGMPRSMEKAWQVLEPLVAAERLLKVIDPDTGSVFVINNFLDHRFRNNADSINWIAHHPGSRVFELQWTEDELRGLLSARLDQCSGDRNIKTFKQLTAHQFDLDKMLIDACNYLPRQLITLCNTVLDEHCRGESPKQITLETAERALQHFTFEEPDPMIRRIEEPEGYRMEKKSTLRVNLYTEKVDKDIEYAIAKTLCGFMNSDGGILYIGVDDTGQVLGLEEDLKRMRGQNEDGFRLAFDNLVENYLGASSNECSAPQKLDHVLSESGVQ